MSRRDIRRLLTQSKPSQSDDGGLVKPVMVVLGGVAVLVAGVVAILALVDDRPETAARHDEPARISLSLPAPREVEPSPPEPVMPVAPAPRPEPGGATQSGMGNNETDDAPELREDAKPVPAPVQQATLPMIMPQPPVPPGVPAWIKYSVPAPKAAGKPMIAVVIDDLGVDRKRSEKVIPLRAPLTLSWMTYAEDLPRLTKESRQRGHELMLHVPMQPLKDSWNPGPDVLDVTVDAEENRRRLIWGLQRFDGFVGINNHMGSRFTGDRVGMRVVMEELRKRGLMFLDSVTTNKSVGAEMARAYAVPFAERNVFIDNEQTVPAVMAQLNKAEAYARKHGAAIVIGHPHDATIDALRQWLPELEAKGLVLVPVSAIVKAAGNG